MTAVDVYWAVFANLSAPMSHEACPMPSFYHDAGCARSADVAAALTPTLLAHRNRTAEYCFEKPM